MTPNTLWNSDPSKSNLGSITINFPHGGSIDLIATNSIRSGAIAAYLELRDKTLVQAQAQIDQLAASMSSALSDKTTADGDPGQPAAAGRLRSRSRRAADRQHHPFDLHGQRRPTRTHNRPIVRVDDPSVLPLPNSATIDPNDEVFGIDFSGGMASVVSQLNARARRAASLQFSNPPARRCGCSTTARPTVRRRSRPRSTTTITSTDQRQCRNCRCSPMTAALYRRDHRRPARSRPDLPRASRSIPAVADPSRLIVYSTSPMTPSGRHHARRISSCRS